MRLNVKTLKSLNKIKQARLDDLAAKDAEKQADEEDRRSFTALKMIGV